MLEDIGGDNDALLCVTNQTACCQSNDTGGPALGNWIFPNGTKVPSDNANRTQWDFYRTRGQMVVYMHRRRGGVEGIYHCEIPDTMNVIQTIYIGVYSASTGEYMYTLLFCNFTLGLCCRRINCDGQQPLQCKLITHTILFVQLNATPMANASYKLCLVNCQVPYAG